MHLYWDNNFLQILLHASLLLGRDATVDGGSGIWGGAGLTGWQGIQEEGAGLARGGSSDGVGGGMVWRRGSRCGVAASIAREGIAMRSGGVTAVAAEP